MCLAALGWHAGTPDANLLMCCIWRLLQEARCLHFHVFVLNICCLPFFGEKYKGKWLEMLALFAHPSKPDHFVDFETTSVTQNIIKLLSNPLVKMGWLRNRPWIGSHLDRKKVGAVVRVQWQTTESTSLFKWKIIDSQVLGGFQLSGASSGSNFQE